ATSLRHHLQQCYVYIHGGKDMSGSPVICFPHFPGLHDVSNEGFKDTLYYLTHTTRYSLADLGFVVILDRRKDKWSSLKATLVRLAENFPGNIRIVLVLKPLGFLQGAITNFGFRWQKDEFAMKVPVVLLSSLDDLSRYVLPTELTNHFGGTFQYDHITWINNRMLVETFSAKATSAILALEEYGSQLAESELPNDSKSAVVLINTQQIRTNTQKDGIEMLRKEAALLRNEISISNNNDVNAIEAGLMECYETLISETDVTFDNFWLKYKEKMKQCLQLRLFEEDYRDVCSKLETVRQQIESKYLNVGITFPWLEAFISGLSDLEQSTNECLEVCGKVRQHGCDLVAAGHYAVDCIQPKTDELQNQTCEIKEQITELQCSFKSYQHFINQLNEVRQWCEDGMAFLAGQVLETSLTVDGANSALNELEIKFEKKEQNVQILVENSVVQSQCGRLWSAEAEELSCHVKSRLTEVTLLYEKRRSSLKKAATKHGERPVQLVEPSKKVVSTTKGSKRDPPRDGKEQVVSQANIFLPYSIYKRNYYIVFFNFYNKNKILKNSFYLQISNISRHVMKELVSTEKTYISELKSIVEGYGRPMDDPTHPRVPATLLGKSKELLGNMDEIYDFHSNVFLGLLEECVDNPSSVGRCFLSKKENFEIYSKYCQNSIKSEQLRRLVGEQHPFFMQCQQKLGHRLSLSAFLLKPVQRVTKYQLLLQQMLKYSNSHLKELQTALDAMLEILKSVNDGMHQVMITGYQDDLTLLGKLHLQSQFTMQVDHKKSRVKSLKRPRFSKAIQRHLFLYDDEILICKPQTMESLDDNDNHFKSNNQSVASMENAGMLDTIKSDPRKFEVWSEGREHVYTLQAPTIITKQEWIKGLKSIL
uniref:MCF.2 cell line derived transforming sequence-like 2 n=1 Tax=Ciona savignyi TaxID=51511 RepID=H2YE26_CIOSA